MFIKKLTIKFLLIFIKKYEDQIHDVNGRYHFLYTIGDYDFEQYKQFIKAKNIECDLYRAKIETLRKAIEDINSL